MNRSLLSALGLGLVMVAAAVQPTSGPTGPEEFSPSAVRDRPSIPQPLFASPVYGEEEGEEELLACGVERWSVKTGTDADADLVDLGSVAATSIASLITWTKPASLPANNRIAPAETTLWQVSATLTKFKLEPDSDYHLVIEDGLGATMITEIAAPSCTGPDSPFLAGIANARDQFDAELNATTSFQTVSIPVLITGVGFFDFSHGQTGLAPNGIELHPVLDIVFYPGPEFALARTPAVVTVPQGGGGAVALSTGIFNGFDAPVMLSASGLPAFAGADFAPATLPAPGAGASTLTLSAGGSTPLGSHPLTVTATGGGITHATPVTLVVAPPGGVAEVSPAGDEVPFTLARDGASLIFRFQHRGAAALYHLYGAPDAAAMNAGAWTTKICDLQANALGSWDTDGTTWIAWTLADASALPDGRFVVVMENGGTEGPYGFQSDGTPVHPDDDRTTPGNLGCVIVCAAVDAAVTGVEPGATVLLGTQQTFAASGSGEGPLTYEWDLHYDWTTFNAEASGTTAAVTYGAAGEYTVALRVTDSCTEPGPRSILDTVGVSIYSTACGPDVVVSQVYGGGGNSGATYTHDFIELFNRGDQPQDLTGWSVQYASAAGSSWSVTGLSGTLPPGRYYLVQEAQGSGGTTSLPAPDAEGTISMAATAGKVAVVSSATPLTGACPSGGALVDLVGYGTTANCFEGTGPAPAPSNTNAVTRGGGGCADTDQNAADFTAAPPTPRHSATATNLCSCP